MHTPFTKQETAAINAAWQAIRELCTRTNWTDSGTWRDAEKLERKQAPTDEPAAIRNTWARAIICKAWAEGLDNPDATARSLYWIRPGYLNALFLGVRHAVERRGEDYNGPIVEEARALCEAAIAANSAHTARIVGG